MFSTYSAFKSTTVSVLSAVKSNPNMKISEFRERIAKSTPYGSLAAYQSSFAPSKGKSKSTTLKGSAQSVQIFDASDLVCPGLTTPVHKFCVMQADANSIVVLVALSQQDEAAKELLVMADSCDWTLAGPAPWEDETVVFTVGKTDIGKNKVSEFRENIAKGTPYASLGINQSSFASSKAPVWTGNDITMPNFAGATKSGSLEEGGQFKQTLSDAIVAEFNRFSVETLHAFVDEVQLSSYQHALVVFDGEHQQWHEPQTFTALKDVAVNFKKHLSYYFSQNVDCQNMGVILSGLREVFIDEAREQSDVDTDIPALLNKAYAAYLENTLVNAMGLTEMDIVWSGGGHITTAVQYRDALVLALTALPTGRPTRRPISKAVKSVLSTTPITGTADAARLKAIVENQDIREAIEYNWDTTEGEPWDDSAIVAAVMSLTGFDYDLGHADFEAIRTHFNQPMYFHVDVYRTQADYENGERETLGTDPYCFLSDALADYNPEQLVRKGEYYKVIIHSQSHGADVDVSYCVDDL